MTHGSLRLNTRTTPTLPITAPGQIWKAIPGFLAADNEWCLRGLAMNCRHIINWCDIWGCRGLGTEGPFTAFPALQPTAAHSFCVVFCVLLITISLTSCASVMQYKPIALVWGEKERERETVKEKERGFDSRLHFISCASKEIHQRAIWFMKWNYD